MTTVLAKSAATTTDLAPSMTAPGPSTTVLAIVVPKDRLLPVAVTSTEEAPASMARGLMVLATSALAASMVPVRGILLDRAAAIGLTRDRTTCKALRITAPSTDRRITDPNRDRLIAAENSARPVMSKDRLIMTASTARLMSKDRRIIEAARWVPLPDLAAIAVRKVVLDSSMDRIIVRRWARLPSHATSAAVDAPVWADLDRVAAPRRSNVVSTRSNARSTASSMN